MTPHGCGVGAHARNWPAALHVGYSVHRRASVVPAPLIGRSPDPDARRAARPVDPRVLPQGWPMEFSALPAQQGLYDPSLEHDACGVAFVVDMHGRRSHTIVQQGLTALIHLEHRGAAGAEVTSGDGAGILIQAPTLRQAWMKLTFFPVGHQGFIQVEQNTQIITIVAVDVRITQTHLFLQNGLTDALTFIFPSNIYKIIYFFSLMSFTFLCLCLTLT